MLGRKALTVFNGQWAALALHMGSAILIARRMGPESIGQMGFAFGIIGLFMMLTGLGFSQAHIKRVAEGMPQGLCIGTFAFLTLALHGMAALLCLASWPWLREAFKTPQEVLVFPLFFIYQTLTSMGLVWVSAFYGAGFAARASVANITAKAVRVLGVAVVLLIYPTLIGLGVVFILEALTQLTMAIRMGPPLAELRRPTRESLESYWKYAKPLALLAPLSTLGDSVDRVILGSYCPAAQVGFYNLARNIFEAVKTVPSAVITVLQPRMTQDYSQGGAEKLKMGFYASYRKILLLTTPLMALGMLWSPWIVTLPFGQAFAPAAPLVAIFFFITWMIGLFSPFHYVLYAIEAHAVYLWISPPSQGLYLAGLWAMIGPWGMAAAGAAWANLIPMLISTAPVILVAARRVGVRFPAITFKYVGAGVAMYFVQTASAHAIAPPWAGALAGSVAGLGAYAAVVWILGAAAREDVAYLLELIHPGKLLRYVRQETSEGI